MPKYLLDGIEVWFGTPEATAPAGVETESAPTITVGVVGAEDIAVYVQYRRPGGPWQRLRLRPNQGTGEERYFTGRFPVLPAGYRIEYEVYVRGGGAQPRPERRAGATMSFEIERRPAVGSADATAAKPTDAGMKRPWPNAFAERPLKAGEVATEVPVSPEESAALYRVAFAEAAGAGQATVDGVVWAVGDSELLVYLARVRLVLRDGFALVGIPVFCEQTGDAEVVVAFAVGRPGAPLGLVMATETAPRGPSLVVERWGEQLVAVAWDALVRVVAGVAAAAGVDDGSHALLPAAVTAGANGLVVLPQARHAFDRARA